MAKKTTDKPSKQQIDKFDMLYPMLRSFLNEVRVLSKTKPNEPLNQMKIRMINRILVQLKDVLASDASVEYLDLLDEETLPQNSDAVLILGQYDAAMDQFKEKHTGDPDGFHSYEKEWLTSD